MTPQWDRMMELANKGTLLWDELQELAHVAVQVARGLRLDLERVEYELTRLREADVFGLRNLLARLEWCGLSTESFGDVVATCPVCRAEKGKGHLPGCELNAALRPIPKEVQT